MTAVATNHRSALHIAKFVVSALAQMDSTFDSVALSSGATITYVLGLAVRAQGIARELQLPHVFPSAVVSMSLVTYKFVISSKIERYFASVPVCLVSAHFPSTSHWPTHCVASNWLSRHTTAPETDGGRCSA